MKVRDYVRTKWGDIARIDKCLGKDKIYKNMEHYEVDTMVGQFNNFILYKKDISKSSPNILDLVKKGDYINGKLVVSVGDNYFMLEKDINKYDKRKVIGVKTIVTKERFEAIQYEVNE